MEEQRNKWSSLSTSDTKKKSQRKPKRTKQKPKEISETITISETVTIEDNEEKHPELSPWEAMRNAIIDSDIKDRIDEMKIHNSVSDKKVTIINRCYIELCALLGESASGEKDHQQSHLELLKNQWDTKYGGCYNINYPCEVDDGEQRKSIEKLMCTMQTILMETCITNIKKPEYQQGMFSPFNLFSNPSTEQHLRNAAESLTKVLRSGIKILKDLNPEQDSAYDVVDLRLERLLLAKIGNPGKQIPDIEQEINEAWARCLQPEEQLAGSALT